MSRGIEPIEREGECDRHAVERKDKWGTWGLGVELKWVGT